MKRIQLFVKFTDGTGRVIANQENTPFGRERIDRLAFELLASRRVAYATARHTDTVNGRD